MPLGKNRPPAISTCRKRRLKGYRCGHQKKKKKKDSKIDLRVLIPYCAVLLYKTACLSAWGMHVLQNEL